MSFDAIVLAGASSERLGGIDKAMVEVAGATLLDHAVAAVAAASQTVIVGPRRTLAAGSADVLWREENPPNGGPVAALAAGVQATAEAMVVVIAADLPFVAGAVPVLCDALDGSAADGAVLVDADGRMNYLAAAWRSVNLRRRLGDLGDLDGCSMRRLFAGLEVIEVPDLGGWSTDCDTWAAIEHARSVTHSD